MPGVHKGWNSLKAFYQKALIQAFYQKVQVIDQLNVKKIPPCVDL